MCVYLLHITSYLTAFILLFSEKQNMEAFISLNFITNNQLEDWMKSLKLPSVKWASMSSIHLTLSLIKLEKPDQDQMKNEIEEALRNIRKPVTIPFERLSLFGEENLVMLVKKEYESGIWEIKRSLEKAITNVELKQEDIFSPHITISRKFQLSSEIDKQKMSLLMLAKYSLDLQVKSVEVRILKRCLQADTNPVVVTVDL